MWNGRETRVKSGWRRCVGGRNSSWHFLGNNEQKESTKKNIENASGFVRSSLGKSLEVKTMALKRYKPIINVFYKNPITEETMKLDI